MYINNTLFNVDLETIITDLQVTLRNNGSLLLGTIKRTQNDIMISCPYHKNGMEKKPSMGISKTDGTCHCFRGDTRVLTSDGSLMIKELLNKDVNILNGNGKWEKVRFVNYGKDLLYKITLSQDQQKKTIYATANHEWFVHCRHRCIMTKNLKTGLYLQTLLLPQVEYTFNLDGFIHGIVYGDGSRGLQYKNYGHGKNRINDKNHPIGCYYSLRIPKFTKKLKLLDYFIEKGWHISDCKVNGKDYFRICSKIFSLTSNYKNPPSLDMSIDYIMSFLSGYFACDGSIDLSNISCSDYVKLNQVRDLCIHCGINVRDIREFNHKSNYVKNGNATLYLLSLHRSSFPDYFYVLEENVKNRKYCRSRWRIDSVEKTDLYEDVYCCTTSTHSFVLDGNILTHNCFSCNRVVSLPELITYCLGEEDKSVTGAPGWRWLLRNYSTVTIDSRKDIQLDFGRDKSRKSETPTYVSEEELDKYRYYHPYWTKRGITDENIIELFDLGYDKNTGCITMPVRDINGNCLFVARRSVQTKYFNYPQGVEKPLYGLYELYHCNDELKAFNGLPATCNEIIICESMIDTITTWQYGKYCLALNGLGTALQFKQLRELPCRKLILATDADEAGMKARQRIKKNVTNKIITEYVWNREEAKDLNDMSREMFLMLKEVYT